MKIKQKRSRAPLFITLAAIIAIGGGIAGAYAYNASKDSPAATAQKTQAASAAQTQAQVDTQKDAFAQKESDAKSATSQSSSNGTAGTGLSTSSLAKASVIITYAGQDDDGTVEVNAYIPDHYEDGTCTLTFTNGSATVTKTSPAYRDATTTICTNPLIKRSEFSTAGTWSLVVSYASNGAAGSSAAQNVTIK